MVFIFLNLQNQTESNQKLNILNIFKILIILILIYIKYNL